MSEETFDPTLLHNSADTGEIDTEVRSEANLLQAGALQSAIFNSANFSYIATDAKGVIQIFNVGAERMLGYTATEVMNKITPADISDPQEVIARAEALSIELGTPITPGFEALVFKASRGIEDIYELTYIRKDGSRFPAVVSVTALRDAQDAIIGYLLIGTDNTARCLEDQGLKTGRNRGSKLEAQCFSSGDNFLRIGNVGRGNFVHHVGGRVAQHPFGADVENLNDPLGISGDTRKVGAVENRALQRPRLEQRLFLLFSSGRISQHNTHLGGLSEGADGVVSCDQVASWVYLLNRCAVGSEVR